VNCHGDHCITCSDEGIEMRVVRVDTARAMALCEDGDGARSSVEIALVEAREGDTLLVHAGTALLTLRPDALPSGVT
jgi:hydrogenase expression/formation protein HypC